MKTKIKFMTLDEFCQVAKDEVDRFRRHWVKKMNQNLDHYPSTLPDFGEWWGQYEAFSSSPED